MNWLRLALANLRASPLTSLVNVILLGLGTASIVLLLLIGEQLSSTLSRDARGIDLVIGAKGSPAQLVLSSVYHADVPTGNIAKAEADRWAADPRVALAVPLSLGDSYRGFRIVGTTPDYAALYDGHLAGGRYWKAPMEAVAGATAAREARLRAGSHLVGAHGVVGGGHAHAGHPYRVVGVLVPTGTILDRLILTSLDSVWELHVAEHGEEQHADEHDADHEHEADRDHEPKHAHHPGTGGEPRMPATPAHDDHAAGEHDGHDVSAAAAEEPREITALLLRYASPLATTTLPQQVNAESRVQAVAPASEITRRLHLVGLGLDGLRIFAGVLILTAAFSVFAALYAALNRRRAAGFRARSRHHGGAGPLARGEPGRDGHRLDLA